MSIAVTPAISASEIVNIIPSVLSAGGNSLDLNGVMLTANPRVPIDTLITFPDAASVTSYFGSGSQESALGSIYFKGFDNSTKKPGQLYFWQYAWLQPVSAWLRGGSVASLSLAQLQALAGTFTVTIDGADKTASISLSGATSFSNAAQTINSSLNIHGIDQGAYVGSINGTTLTVGTVTNGPQQATFVGSITGGTLTVTSLTEGNIAAGQLLVGTGVTVGTTITAGLTGVGGVGTYSITPNGTAASQNITSYINAGALALGDLVLGTGTPNNVYISAFLTGTGGLGTYTLSGSGVMSNSAFNAFLPGVTYDSTSGGFQINSGTTGSGSTMSYASGALAVSLNMTSATGATLSQGSGQPTPAQAMDAIVGINQNWASFMTLFEPVETDKEAFSTWNNAQANRYHYAMWDTNAVNTGPSGPSTAVGVITTGNYSGTSLIYENSAVDTIGGELAAFVMGYGASINFNAFQGRATAAFKSQSGLAPQVFSTTAYNYLRSYGMNCYGDFTTANQAFTIYSNGTVSGPFTWLDSYLDQIWLRAQLQVQLMSLLTQVNSIPYNNYGYGLIQAACEDPIQAAVFSGVIQPGVPLSNAQAAEVFSITGSTQAAGIISTRGWFLQIVPASAQVRAARQSPNINLLYTDGESVQQIVINAVLIQ